MHSHPLMKRSHLLLLLAALVAAPLHAQAVAGTDGHVATGGPPSLNAARLQGSIQLDGRLDEAAWQGAPAAGGFTQSYPNPGATPRARTEARILYTDDALYAGVRMYDDQPDSIAAQLARRDPEGIYSDWVHLIVGSCHDGRTACRFSVNP